MIDRKAHSINTKAINII